MFNGDDPRALVDCPHCVSKVQGGRLSLHISKVHKIVPGKQQCVLNADHKVDDLAHHLEEECAAMVELQKNAYDGGGISTVPAPPPCNVDFGDAENWDTANYPAYDPLENTKTKNIIRGSYASGLQPAQRKLVVKEERVRRAELNERESSDRMNRISTKQMQFNTRPDLSSQRGDAFNAPGYSTMNIQPKTCNRIPSSLVNNFDSSMSLPMHNGYTNGSYAASNNDPTTDSDGYTSVNYNKRGNSRGRGRGRERF